MAYTKLFSSIITSTIWRESDTIRIVWITMLASANKHGEVQASIPGLAHIAGVSLDSCEEALRKFLSPDPYSRTKDDEGRRIQEIAGGWLILNHAKYREMASKDEAISANAERQKRFRERSKRNGTVTVSNGPVTQDRPIADTESRIAEVPKRVCTSVVRPAREAKVEVPTDSHTQVQIVKEDLGGMFGRNGHSPWSYEEEHALAELMRRPVFFVELDELKAMKRDRPKFFPRSLTKLITNWTTVLDQSRSAAEPKNKPVNHDIEYLKKICT